MRGKTVLWLVLLFFALLIAGCNGPAPQNDGVAVPDGTGQQSSVSSTPDNAPVNKETMRITTYQATKDAMFLAPEVHVVQKNSQPAQVALELLTAGPSSPDHVAVVPAGTKVLGVTVKNHIAYADFNDRLIKNNTGGSAEEMLLVSAIVDTLTDFPDIEKVQILVNGRRVNTITGHMDTSEPLSRAEKIIRP